MARRATLLVIPASNASWTAQLALEHKGVPYRAVVLPPFTHRGVVRAAGFPRPTVPALYVEGRRMQGTRQINRLLEELFPEPPLYPADPALRERVLQAEAWGEEWLQPVLRRIFPWVLLRSSVEERASVIDTPVLGLPPGVVARIAAPAVAAMGRINRSNAEAVRGTLGSLPGLLDEADRLIAAGVIGGASLNAADFEIAPTLRALTWFEDLQPLVAGRPASELGLRVAPGYQGRIGPVFPREWLDAVRG